MSELVRPTDDWYDWMCSIRKTSIWYMLLTPEMRYDEDGAYCPKCSSAMSWKEYFYPEHGMDANCTNPECPFTDGT